MEGLRTNLLPYYLTCRTCGWEEWVEEPSWLQHSVDHMEASTWKHSRVVGIGSTVIVWGGTGISTGIRKFRNLFIS